MRNTIENTEFYKKLNSQQKKIISKHANVKLIENGINVADYIGLDKWLKTFNPPYLNGQIVTEILTNNLWPNRITQA